MAQNEAVITAIQKPRLKQDRPFTSDEIEQSLQFAKNANTIISITYEEVESELDPIIYPHKLFSFKSLRQ